MFLNKERKAATANWTRGGLRRIEEERVRMVEMGDGGAERMTT